MRRGRAERVAVVFYGGTALVIELLLRACVRYARAHPELVLGGPGAPPEPPTARGWRAAACTALYALLILLGIFLVPRLAAFGYLAVALDRRARARAARGGSGWAPCSAAAMDRSRSCAACSP